MTRCASVSLDLDNKWSYLKTHGDPRWSEYPSYLDVAVPRILECLNRLDIRISFFIVGQDAALEKNKIALGEIASAGHEIANHSFNHDPWLHLYSEEQLDAELEAAESAIAGATGRKTLGFRGPGFSLSSATLRVLARRGYEYDATVFPNVLNPLARAYFFANSKLSAEEREKRKALFGSWKDALKPIKPFVWELDGKSLVEIPVTTMPLFRVPIHLSYVIYLGRISRLLARTYFGFALLLCRLTRTAPSILLHPLDFLGKEDDSDLGFFPGMDLSASYKISLVEETLRMLAAHYRLVTVGEHVRSVPASRLKRVVGMEVGTESRAGDLS